MPVACVGLELRADRQRIFIDTRVSIRRVCQRIPRGRLTRSARAAILGAHGRHILNQILTPVIFSDADYVIRSLCISPFHSCKARPAHSHQTSHHTDTDKNHQNGQKEGFQPSSPR